MNRVTSFVLGVVVGAAGLYVSENYYVVRSSKSVHMVPKVAAKLEFPYRDIRAYSVEDWKQNPALGLAIVRANKADLMIDSFDSVRQNFENMLRSWSGGS